MWGGGGAVDSFGMFFFFLKIDGFGNTPRIKLYSYFLNHAVFIVMVVEGLIELEMDLVKQLVLVLYSGKAVLVV